MADQIDRRKFLARGARTLTGAAALGVAGPRLFEGSRLAHSPSAGVKPGSLGALAMVGAWVPDVETGGEYIADTEGYWKQLGFSSVDIIPSGPNAPPQEVTVETGRALYGLSSLDATSAAIVKGFGLVPQIPPGPNAPPQEVTVETGRALYGLSSLDATSAAIVKGFGLVVIGA